MTDRIYSFEQNPCHCTAAASSSARITPLVDTADLVVSVFVRLGELRITAVEA